MTSLSRVEMKALRIPLSSYLGLNNITCLDQNGGFMKMFAWEVLKLGTCSAKFLSLRSEVCSKWRDRILTKTFKVLLEVVGYCPQV